MTTTVTEATVSNQQNSNGEYPRLVKVTNSFCIQTGPVEGNYVPVVDYAHIAADGTYTFTQHFRPTEVHTEDSTVTIDGRVYQRLMKAEVGQEVISVDNTNGFAIGQKGVVESVSTPRIVRVRPENGITRSEYVYNLALPQPQPDVSALAELLSTGTEEATNIRAAWRVEKERVLEVAREAADDFEWCEVFEAGCAAAGVEGRDREEDVIVNLRADVLLDSDTLMHWIDGRYGVDSDVEDSLRFSINLSTERTVHREQCGCDDVDTDHVSELIPDGLELVDWEATGCDNC